MDSDLNIVVSQEQGRVPVTVFRIKGAIDARTYEQLQTQASEAFKTGMRNLLLDLTEVSYISSAGMRAIHVIFMMLRGESPEESDEGMRKGLLDGTFQSPHLKLLNPSPTVHKVIQGLGFDMFLEIHKSLKEAMASYGDPAQ